MDKHEFLIKLNHMLLEARKLEHDALFDDAAQMAAGRAAAIEEVLDLTEDLND